MNEVDKNKSISEMTMEELRIFVERLRTEQNAESLMMELQRNAERKTYDNLGADTTTPVNQLYHYGILGMKWGVTTKSSSGRQSKDSTIKSKRKQMSSVRRHLSDGELKKAVERLQMEKKLKDLTEEDVAPGKVTAKKVLGQIGKGAITAAGTAVATYAIKAALQGEFNVKDAAKFIVPKKK